MHKPLKFLGRGLLVLMLSGYAIGCGDDDDDNGDSGVDGGTAGNGGGTGGKGEGTGGKGNGTDAGSMTDAGKPAMSECVAAVNTATSNMSTAACTECVCQNGPAEAVVCNATCWNLITCFATKCVGIDPNETDAANKCAVENCPTFVGATGTAGPLGKVITASCSDVCVAPSATDDAGTEDGGT